jgi:hypothetical protein
MYLQELQGMVVWQRVIALERPHTSLSAEVCYLERASAALHCTALQALDPTDKDHALRALARVTTAPLISRTLQYALSPAVRTQDVAKLLVDIAKQGGLGFNKTWEFIISHSDDIMKKYGGEELQRKGLCKNKCYRDCHSMSCNQQAWHGLQWKRNAAAATWSTILQFSGNCLQAVVSCCM